jgi:hypothetical protein
MDAEHHEQNYASLAGLRHDHETNSCLGIIYRHISAKTCGGGPTSVGRNIKWKPWGYKLNSYKYNVAVAQR